jgi:hypothetical protein
LLDFFVDFSVLGGASTARARVVRRDAALRAARWILGRTGAPLIAEDIDETAEDILGGGSAVPNAPPIPRRTLSATTDQAREKVKPAPRKIVTRTHLGRVKWVGPKSRNNSRPFGL